MSLSARIHLPYPSVTPASVRAAQEQVEAALRAAEAHTVPLSEKAGQYAEAFRSACQLLVVLSSFPGSDDRDELAPEEPGQTPAPGQTSTLTLTLTPADID